MKGEYKAIFLPPKLHKKIKAKAVEKEITMIELLEEKFK